MISKAIEFIRTLQDIASEKSRIRVMVNTLREGVLTTDHQERIVLAMIDFFKRLPVRLFSLSFQAKNHMHDVRLRTGR
ncbi:MAG: hypothetical protein ACNA7H_03275 [Desulfotignum sp.]